MPTVGNTPRPGYVYDQETDTWIPIGVGPHTHDYVDKTLLDAKGDLFVASSADTPAKLTVGNNGETLVADSSATTGLRWQGNYAAGKNAIINGDFRIWQRGTSFTQADSFSADRWQITFGGAVPTAAAISQQAFTAGTAPVAGYEGNFFMRMVTTTIGSCTAAGFQQLVEDVRTFAGQTITVSFWAKADAARTVTLITRQNFGSGGSTATFVEIGTASVTTSWARYSVTYTVPSVSGKTIGTSSFLAIGIRMTTVANGGTLDLWGVQAESGSVATAFQTATGTLAGELAACQRYYQQVLTGTKALGIGSYYSASAMGAYVYLTVEMRTTPTLSATSGTNYYAIYAPIGDAFDALTLSGDTTTRLLFLTNSSQVSGTAGYAGEVYGNSASASVGVSAEL
jgi:hypothetical protein